MQHFQPRNGELHVEDVPLSAVAERFGTPTYVYSRAAFTQHYLSYAQALGDHPGMVCYAIKANSNLAILNLLAKLGAGFDIVSGGELERVLRAGGDPSRIVFSGVGKTPEEMARALDVGIFCFNVESEAELEILAQVAADKGMVANISLRVNPDVDANTHPYIHRSERKQIRYRHPTRAGGLSSRRQIAEPEDQRAGLPYRLPAHATDALPRRAGSLAAAG